MARTTSRGAHMIKSLVIRVSEEDDANIKIAAQRRGMDKSAMVRKMLIDAHIIEPVCSELDNI